MKRAQKKYSPLVQEAIYVSVYLLQHQEWPSYPDVAELTSSSRKRFVSRLFFPLSPRSCTAIFTYSIWF